MFTLDQFAKQLSHKLHEGQFRNDRVTPYTVHTDFVGDNAEKFFPRSISPTTSLVEVTRAVGYLHDSIEDVLRDEKKLFILDSLMAYERWGEVCRHVNTLSRLDKGEQDIITYLSRIKMNAVTIAVKLADLEHNMSDLKPGNLRDKYELCWEFLTHEENL